MTQQEYIELRDRLNETIQRFSEVCKTNVDAIQKLILPQIQNIEDAQRSLSALADRISEMQSALLRACESNGLLKPINSDVDDLLSAASEAIETAEPYLPEEELRPIKEEVESTKRNKHNLTILDVVDFVEKILSIINTVICLVSYLFPDDQATVVSTVSNIIEKIMTELDGL